ncbi:MAG: DUF357 domain-containing protein [Candidatus Altiarchaeota archaeon]
MDELRAKLDRYIRKAETAFGDVTVAAPGGEKVRDTALRYYSDAKHFMSKGELVNAFAALEYAEGWLDAGIVLGVVKAEGKRPENF